jgi:hypothetical protein
MVHRRIAAILVALVAATVALAPAAQAGGQPFTTMLTGAAEVPGPGDPDGSGTAVITINRGLGEVCWRIAVSGITLPATAAHIHEAPVGVEGDVVVTLSPPNAAGVSSGCTAVSRELAKEIAKDPAAYYVNVHNVPFPAGAARGQLG